MSSVVFSRKSSFIILAIIYVAAAGWGFLAWYFLKNAQCNPFLSIFIADVIATVFVWAFGLFYRNVSVYDPYWSVLPPVVLTAYAVHVGNIGLSGILMLTAVWYWGIRLTGNWAYTFRNLNSEDWRYAKYRREQKPFIFQIINFFGLNMMPTIVVFVAMCPALELLTGYVTTDHYTTAPHFVPYGWNGLTLLGFVLCIAAASIQLVADTQRHRFAREHRGEVCKVGLWKHGRHPNYFGEILMWWGVWVMFASVGKFGIPLLYLPAPIAMTCLFLFISIPLMEKRQLQNKPGYAQYRKETRMLI